MRWERVRVVANVITRACCRNEPTLVFVSASFFSFSVTAATDFCNITLNIFNYITTVGSASVCILALYSHFAVFPTAWFRRR